jgi:hypothetical protein
MRMTGVHPDEEPGRGVQAQLPRDLRRAVAVDREAAQPLQQAERQPPRVDFGAGDGLAVGLGDRGRDLVERRPDQAGRLQQLDLGLVADAARDRQQLLPQLHVTDSERPHHIGHGHVLLGSAGAQLAAAGQLLVAEQPAAAQALQHGLDVAPYRLPKVLDRHRPHRLVGRQRTEDSSNGSVRDGIEARSRPVDHLGDQRHGASLL